MMRVLDRKVTENSNLQSTAIALLGICIRRMLVTLVLMVDKRYVKVSIRQDRDPDRRRLTWAKRAQRMPTSIASEYSNVAQSNIALIHYDGLNAALCNDKRDYDCDCCEGRCREKHCSGLAHVNHNRGLGAAVLQA
jgi:hypothetical protein